jgi:hypothetical protein
MGFKGERRSGTGRGFQDGKQGFSEPGTGITWQVIV